MEAFETAAAHRPPVATRTGRRRRLPGRTLAVDDDLDLDWVEGWDLATGETVWVPVDAVWFRPGAPRPVAAQTPTVSRRETPSPRRWPTAWRR